MKICTICKQEKSEEEFFIRDNKTGRRHAQCKECYKVKRQSFAKEHYEKYKAEYKARAVSRNRKTRRQNKIKLIEYLQSHPCVDCGEKDIVVLEFDHLNPSQKKDEITHMVRQSHSWNAIMKEILKCEVVCANCHRRRTAQRDDWYKYQVSSQ